MKTSKTLLFIIAVFTMMGAIGYAVPTEGITIADTTLTFPRITDMLRSEQPQIDSTQAYIHAKQMRQFMQTQRLSEEMQRRMAVLRHKYAINYPADSIEWIYPLFDALQKADRQPVRILHYGDSQIEIDRITSDLRQSLMSRFGGYGVGLIPAIQTIPTTAISQECDVQLTRYMAYGPAEMRFDTARYGVMAQTALVDGEALFSFRTTSMAKPCTRKFGRLTILTDLIDGTLTATLTAGDHTAQKAAPQGTTSITFDLPDSTRQATLKIKGKGLIHAFLLDGDDHGIQYDNAAMRGCSGTIFTAIDSKSMASYFDRYSIPLIIMQYGGNVVPYIKTEKQIADYCTSLQRQIRYLQRLSPRSKILFIGPSDMSTNINGQMQSYPNIKLIAEALRNTCNANNVAFWSLYDAMGGENSMTRWVKQQPPLAGSDHVHFTPAGATHTAEMLLEAIYSAYDYYIEETTVQN